MYNLKNKPK